MVTGASRGIGKATAIEFAKQGATAIINYQKSVTEANEAVEEIKILGGKAIACQCDVSSENQVKSMVVKIMGECSKIDVLVNNAGFAKQNSLSGLSAEDFRKTLEVNLLGPFLCTKYVAAEMIRTGGGKIVNVSSIRGLENCARKDIIDYSAAKAGVINITKSLAKELTPFGINVNAVAPAITRTELAKKLTEEAKQKAIAGSLIKRMAEPLEIAKAILFLASEDANYITGEVLVIDGGYNLTEL